MKQKWTIYLTTVSMAEILHYYFSFHSLDVFSPCFACYLFLLLFLLQIPRVPYWAAKWTVVNWPWLDIRCPQSWSTTPFFCRTEGRKEDEKKPLWIKKNKQCNKAKTKDMHGSKEKADSFSSSHLQMSLCFPGSWALLHVEAAPEDKQKHSKTNAPSSSPLFS